MKVHTLGLTLSFGIGLLAVTLAPVRAAEPYDINVVLPLTGNAAFLGTGEQRALQLMEKQVAARGVTIGGRPVHFLFHDDQSSPQVAVQVTNEITRSQPKPAVILGSTLVSMCNAMAPSMRNGPVMYCFSPGIYPAKDSYVFSTSVATRDLAASLLRYYRAQGWMRVALITSTDASGQDALRNIKELLASDENRDMQLAGEATFNPADTSVNAQMQRLKATDAKALIAWSSGTPIGTVFRAIVDAGWDVPVGTTDGNMTYAQMTQYKDILPKQLLIPASVWPLDPAATFSAEIEAAKRNYYDAFQGQDVRPDAAGTFAWDPAALVISALQKLGPDATAMQLRDHIAASKGFAGVNGNYDFVHDPQRGLDDSNVVITRWEAGRATWLVVSGPRGLPLSKS